MTWAIVFLCVFGAIVVGFLFAAPFITPLYPNCGPQCPYENGCKWYLCLHPEDHPEYAAKKAALDKRHPRKKARGG